MKNAKEHIQSSLKDLQNARTCLQDALQSVEKPENRTKIQDTFNAVDGALTKAQDTINTYKES
ncbi:MULTISPECIES: EscE/YscE/SsaE family type III secretion system needle protein co-chaperone [Clostridium]|uniref:Uncharacterized protein n=1 Tax=Clostridium paridis TaxID=2803863 RepID=A0A937K4L1_9CLOT|nr:MULTISPECIES: EscE/YscE/SsaE family type III secretion system needle protein co-chaperone [Clostridium]MBL4933431.1 hypothetical protein [Clostridium paridis]